MVGHTGKGSSKRVSAVGASAAKSEASAGAPVKATALEEKGVPSTKKERRYFGTDGIRGVAGALPLDSFTMVRLGKAIAKHFMRDSRKHRILIGKDTRLSGYMIETALASGITSMGADVQLVGPLPTPGVAYLTRSMRSDAGIMISASHNPFEDNGIKIFGANGYKLPDAVELELEALMAPGVMDEASAPAASIGKATRIDDAVGRYTVFLKSTFPRECTLEGLRIGFDAAHGAAYGVGPQTFSELGAEVVSRGVSPNGRNINAGFGSLYPEVVSRLVVEQNLNIGIALDGDADRVIFTDEKGAIIDGDAVLALCAIDLKERGLLRSPRVVSTVMANMGLERFLAPHGITVVRAQVGDRYVLEEMLQQGLQIGGEQSGHMIFSDYATTGDGLLTAMQVLAILSRTKRPLSELVRGFERFPQKLLNIPVASKPPLESVPAVTEAIARVESELGSSGRVLVRYSGTESKIRIMVECETEELCKRYSGDLAEIISRELGS